VHTLAAVLATALAIVVVAVPPLTQRRACRQLLKRLRVGTGTRLAYFRHVMIRDWVAAGLVLAVGLLAGRSPRSIGVPAYRPGGVNAPLVAAALALTAASLVPVLFVLRRRGPQQDDRLVRQLRPVIGLVPAARRDRAGFAALSVTAGICEEVVFRGFGIAYVRWLWPDVSWPWLILLTSVPFGVAHLYQGRGGMTFAVIVGGILCWVTLATGSLLPAMVIHATVDLRNLAIPGELAARAAAEQGLLPNAASDSAPT
jgi:CAAX protease family protein